MGFFRLSRLDLAGKLGRSFGGLILPPPLWKRKLSHYRSPESLPFPETTTTLVHSTLTQLSPISNTGRIPSRKMHSSAPNSLRLKILLVSYCAHRIKCDFPASMMIPMCRAERCGAPKHY